MPVVSRLAACFVTVLALAAAAPVAAAETCPFISDRELATAMPGAKWSLISNQDGRGCIYQGPGADVMMLTVFRNPDAQRAKELYPTFIKALAERMPIAAVPGLGEETQAGTTAANAARQENAIITLAGEYIVSISIYQSGRPASDAALKPLAEIAKIAVANTGKTSERFGGCEWLTADDAEGFLDRATLTIQRTGANSCLVYDGEANSMIVAVITMSRDTQLSMMKRTGGCKHVVIPELGSEAFGEHSCNSGNTNAVHIFIWKNGKQASVLFAPTKPHAQSGSVEKLKAVAGRVYGKL